MHLGLPTQAVAVFMLTIVLLILASDSDWDWFEVGDSVSCRSCAWQTCLPTEVWVGCFRDEFIFVVLSVSLEWLLFDGTFTIPRLGGTVPSAACRGPYPMRFHARRLASVTSGRMSPRYADSHE